MLLARSKFYEASFIFWGLIIGFFKYFFCMPWILAIALQIHWMLLRIILACRLVQLDTREVQTERHYMLVEGEKSLNSHHPLFVNMTVS